MQPRGSFFLIGLITAVPNNSSCLSGLALGLLHIRFCLAARGIRLAKGDHWSFVTQVIKGKYGDILSVKSTFYEVMNVQRQSELMSDSSSYNHKHTTVVK